MEKIHYISFFFKNHSSKITYDNLNFYVNSKEPSVLAELTANNITFEVESNRLLLKLRNYIIDDLIPYTDLKLFETDFLDKDFLILNVDGDYCYKGTNGKITYNDEADKRFLTRCENLVAYFRLFSVVNSETFADHINPANSEIVLFSSVNGVFKVVYDTIPVISDEKLYIETIPELIASAESLILKQYVKNAFFNFSNGTGKINLLFIFENASDINLSYKRDYELVSKLFNFKTFRDSLYLEKEKYFNDIREIANKIFGQAVGIPISISATVFVTYKISDDNVILFIVLFSFLIYVAFYIRIQSIYKSELIEIKENFERDFAIIKADSGLDDSTIEKEKNKVVSKIDKSLDIVNWLIYTIVLLTVILGIFIFYQIYSNEKTLLQFAVFIFKSLFTK